MRASSTRSLPVAAAAILTGCALTGPAPTPGTPSAVAPAARTSVAAAGSSLTPPVLMPALAAPAQPGPSAQPAPAKLTASEEQIVLKKRKKASKDAAPQVPLKCVGDGVSGERVQFVYLYDRARGNHYRAYAATFQAAARGANAVFVRSSGGRRAIRAVTARAGGSCAAAVIVVAASTRDLSSFEAVEQRVVAAGLTREDRKYLVWAESAAECGRAQLSNDSRKTKWNPNNAGATVGVAFRPCWDAATTAHELAHTLGAVQDDAPHGTKLGHCYDEHDVMCYADGSRFRMRNVCPSRAGELLLDCRGDDYFNVNPRRGSYLATHWNVADNAFLIGGGPAMPLRPLPPRGLKVTSASDDGTVTVTWSAPPARAGGVQKYELYDDPDYGTLIGTAPVGASTLTVKLNDLGRRYTLGLAAANEAGTGDEATVSVVVGSALPATPTQLATSWGDAGLTLSWEQTGYASGWIVFRDGAQVGRAEYQNYDDETVPTDGPHTYAVQAVNAVGVSPLSAGLTVDTRPMPALTATFEHITCGFPACGRVHYVLATGVDRLAAIEVEVDQGYPYTTDPDFTDGVFLYGLDQGRSHTVRVRAQGVSGPPGPWATVTFTT